MTRTLVGGCLCGAVRYRVEDTMGWVPYACHCTDCQTRSGSAFGLQLGVRADEISSSGEMMVGHHTQPSGAVARIYACANCLTRLWTDNDQRPGVINLRAGTLDDSQHLVPGFHLYASSCQPWLRLPDGVPVLEGQPTDVSHWLRLLTGTDT